MARPAQFHEPDILTRSMLLFWRKGFEATSIRDLEETTGLKASSLYNRFQSKEALFARALDHYIERVVQFRIDRHLNDADALTGLRRFFETTYDYIDAERPAMACLLTNTALEKASQDPAVREQLNRGTTLLRNAFGSCLMRAQENGQLASDYDCEQGARLMMLCLQGLLVDSTIHPDPAWLVRHVDAMFATLPITSGPSLQESTDGISAHPR